MFGPEKIMKWCDKHLQEMRRSRRSALKMGCFHEVGTKDCAARLYTSHGFTSAMASITDTWSVRSA